MSPHLSLRRLNPPQPRSPTPGNDYPHDQLYYFQSSRETSPSPPAVPNPPSPPTVPNHCSQAVQTSEEHPPVKLGQRQMNMPQRDAKVSFI